MFLNQSKKKVHYGNKIKDIERKYFTTTDYNKFTSDTLDVKIKQKNLVEESDISYLVNNTDLNTKLSILATKAEWFSKYVCLSANIS